MEQFNRRQRDDEKYAMQKRCPVCDARGGDVCSPLPVYPDRDFPRRVHEMRHGPDAPFDFKGSPSALR